MYNTHKHTWKHNCVIFLASFVASSTFVQIYNKIQYQVCYLHVTSKYFWKTVWMTEVKSGRQTNSDSHTSPCLSIDARLSEWKKRKNKKCFLYAHVGRVSTSLLHITVTPTNHKTATLEGTSGGLNLTKLSLWPTVCPGHQWYVSMHCQAACPFLQLLELFANFFLFFIFSLSLICTCLHHLAPSLIHSHSKILCKTLPMWSSSHPYLFHFKGKLMKSNPN